MLLLAFDTATPVITVAVHDGRSVTGESSSAGAMAHGELLGPAIAAALEEAQVGPDQLTDIAVGVGPGPFTGLRVGVVTALTLAETLAIRAVGVCSLDIVAAEASAAQSTEFIVTTDARRKEVYWARYNAEGNRLSDPAVDKPVVVADLGLPVVGRGGDQYADIFGTTGGPLDPNASFLAELVVSNRASLLPVEPLYLRRPDAAENFVAKQA